MGEGGDRCARCGRPINTTSSMWTPTAPGELCAYCLTGHGPGYMEQTEPDWWLGRWLVHSRWTRWFFGRRGS